MPYYQSPYKSAPVPAAAVKPQSFAGSADIAAATCRVYQVGLEKKSTWGGSGVVVKVEAQRAFVITNKHAAPKPHFGLGVYFPCERAFFVHVAAIHNTADLSLLEVRGDIGGLGIKAVTVAGQEPARNAAVFGVAYPAGVGPALLPGTWQGRGGPLNGTGAPSCVATMPTTAGNSGGGCYTANGQLCGLIFARPIDGLDVSPIGFMVALPVVREFLEICFKDLKAAPTPTPSPSPTPPASKSAPMVQPAAADPWPIIEDLRKDVKAMHQQLPALQGGLAALEVKAGQLGAVAGVPGPQGLQGPAGTPGLPADPQALNGLQDKLGKIKEDAAQALAVAQKVEDKVGTAWVVPVATGIGYAIGLPALGIIAAWLLRIRGVAKAAAAVSAGAAMSAPLPPPQPQAPPQTPQPAVLTQHEFVGVQGPDLVAKAYEWANKKAVEQRPGMAADVKYIESLAAQWLSGQKGANANA